MWNIPCIHIIIISYIRDIIPQRLFSDKCRWVTLPEELMMTPCHSLSGAADIQPLFHLHCSPPVTSYNACRTLLSLSAELSWHHEKMNITAKFAGLHKVSTDTKYGFISWIKWNYAVIIYRYDSHLSQKHYMHIYKTTVSDKCES